MIDGVQDDPTDYLAKAKQLRAAGVSTADIAQYLRSKGALHEGPITPSHSKFSPAELQQHADQSVDAATADTQSSLDDLQHTVVDVPLAGYAALEASPTIAKSIPAVLKRGGNVLKVVRGGVGAARDAARLVSGNPLPIARRVAGWVADATKMGTKTPPFSSPAPVASAVNGVEAGGGALRRAMNSPLPQGTPRSVLERQFQGVVDEGRAGYEASLHKGTTVTGDPPDNPDLMRRIEESLRRAKAEREAVPRFRPTGGQSSGRSVADVLRANRSP